MAGDWIKVQTCTPDKPEVHLIAERLQIDPDAVTGKLIRVWCWADQQTIDGNARSVTKTLLDRITCVTGFADCLLSVGWLIETEAGFVFPHFNRHNGNTAKTRATSAKRVEKHRKTDVTEMKRKCNAETVTKALPEKRREEKSIVSKETIESTATALPSRSFSPPTIPDVIEFVLEKSLCIDAADFVNFYASKNWMVGKSKMKDWRAAALGWDSRNRKEATNGRQNQRKQTTAEAREQLNASGFEWIRQAAAEAEAAASGYNGGEIPAGTGATLLLEKHSTTDATCF